MFSSDDGFCLCYLFVVLCLSLFCDSVNTTKGVCLKVTMSKPAAVGGPSANPTAGAGGAQPQGTQELTAFVQNLLQQMQTRFQEMSDAIIARIDEMGTRIDDLEKSIAELMQQAGVEDGDTAAAVPK